MEQLIWEVPSLLSLSLFSPFPFSPTVKQGTCVEGGSKRKRSTLRRYEALSTRENVWCANLDGKSRIKRCACYGRPPREDLFSLLKINPRWQVNQFPVPWQRNLLETGRIVILFITFFQVNFLFASSTKLLRYVSFYEKFFFVYLFPFSLLFPFFFFCPYPASRTCTQ